MSNVENNLFAASVIRQIGLSLLQVPTESLVNLLQASCEGVRLDFRFQARWLLRGLKLHHPMVVVIRTEWSHPRRGVYRVILSEFN
jgi:hypothetical protein